jgi:hypothetical protein
LESLGDSLPEVRYSMQNVMAVQYWFAGRYAEGAASARRALAISSEATVSRAMTVGTLAVCLAGLGDAIGAAEAQREAADLIIRFDLRGSASETLVNFGRVALVAGDEAQAAAFVAAGKRLAAELLSVVEDPLWNDPSYAALIDRHPDTASSLDGLGWEDALRLAIAWRPPASATRGRPLAAALGSASPQSVRMERAAGVKPPPSERDHHTEPLAHHPPAPPDPRRRIPGPAPLDG